MSNGWFYATFIFEIMSKQKISLFILLLFISVAGYSQNSDDTGRRRNKYINISFASSTMEQDNFPKLKSNYGVGFTVGKTFYLHKQPIANCLRFGIDATWFDINYTNYKIERITYWGTDKYDYHQGEVSMHVGPSLTITPVKNLYIVGYIRYAPTFSGLYANDKFSGNYASMFVGGASLSYGVVGLGIESRFGNSKHNAFSFDKNSKDVDKVKTTCCGFRAFISFRF